MKVKLLSDLHLDHHNQEFIFDSGSGDLLILAGDILCAKHLKTNGHLNRIYRSFLNNCSNNFKNVIYVLGNHEYYGCHYESTLETISSILPSNIHLLNDASIKIDDWVFVGGTLWTDHNKENPMNMLENCMVMNDYATIRIGSAFRKLRPEDTLNFHRNTKQYFENQSDIHRDDNVFIISHMSPSYFSVHPLYQFSKYNSAYCNDMNEWIINRPQIKYWAHGHIHYAQDYKIDHCRILCNPMGYSRENTKFNPDLEIEL